MRGAGGGTSDDADPEPEADAFNVEALGAVIVGTGINESGIDAPKNRSSL